MSIASASHPLLYLRYVDDIFAVFKTNESCLKFSNILNSQHKNIKFTVEYGSELMCFLDVQIKVKENGYDTWTGRKTTHTRDGNRSGRPALVGSTGRSGQDSSTGRSSRLKNRSNSPFWQPKDILAPTEIYLNILS